MTCTDRLVTADNRGIKRAGLPPEAPWGRAELERRHGGRRIAVTEKTGQTAGVESHLCNEVSRYRVEHNVIPLWGQTTQCGTGVSIPASPDLVVSCGRVQLRGGVRSLTKLRLKLQSWKFPHRVCFPGACSSGSPLH